MEISLNICCVKRTIWASLVIQWLIIRLAMQGTLLPSQVQEDPTGLRSAEPMRHNSWTCPLDPSSCNCWAHTSQLLKLMCPRDCTPQQERLPQWEACTLQLEKAHPELQRPSTAKNIYFFFLRENTMYQRPYTGHGQVLTWWQWRCKSTWPSWLGQLSLLETMKKHHHSLILISVFKQYLLCSHVWSTGLVAKDKMT